MTSDTAPAPVPRYELHCHLDGSLRPSTIAELAREQGIALTAPVEHLVTAPADCGSLTRFLPYFDLPLQVLQTPEALRRAARELVEDFHADGVVHGEVRFAPQLHGHRGMTQDEAVSSVAEGLTAGRGATGVATGLLLCCLRHQTPQESLAVAETALRHRGVVAGLDLAGDEQLYPATPHRGVVAGLDLAGDEQLYPATPHRGAFELAHAAGLACTVHAGEAAGPAGMWEAIDVLGARRIGHGVRCVGDRALLDRLRREGIALEMCPTSNVQTGAVAGLLDHPATALLGDGLSVTINTDARTTSATTLGHEFRMLREAAGWTTEHEARAQSHAAEAAFTLPAAIEPSRARRREQ
ncbi:adenosine deaminase [Halopolyspora algeriensis]|uniref:adenosine deaminase n=1 Tax=Halopolyspora algeriensis TaxID=1500506 RepID=A0A368VV12_9ACTN|nr:adenosine deaminase [Halopolyspora algeriensis]RCW45934.1 adenosine deaminase [Halopolyspora algeriensis]TQM55347.1 adenosine deaminase [Halopolyspora algeriensis]